MKKLFLGFFIILVLVTNTACSTQNSNAPVIKNSFFLLKDNEFDSLLKNNPDWDDLKNLSKTTMLTSEKYELIIIYSDSDVDVCELQSGWSKDYLLPYPFTQKYEDEQFRIGINFDENDISNSSRSFYVRLKDSKGNYSNIFEIKNIIIK